MKAVDIEKCIAVEEYFAQLQAKGIIQGYTVQRGKSFDTSKINLQVHEDMLDFVFGNQNIEMPADKTSH